MVPFSRPGASTDVNAERQRLPDDGGLRDRILKHARSVDGPQLQFNDRYRTGGFHRMKKPAGRAGCAGRNPLFAEVLGE